jgi:uncharacterized protein (TIGR04222 family)
MVRINATDIRSDGWVEASMTFPRDAFASAPPLWQQHADRVAAGSTKWLIAAGLILGTGVILLVAWRQSYDAPRDDTRSGGDSLHHAEPPADLSPALAGVLAANGSPSLEHGMASLFGLAERGEIEISERARGAFGQRSFIVTRRRRSQGLTPYEQAAIDTIFTLKGQPVDEVTLSAARSRLTRKFRVFSKALTAELMARGLLDPSRKALRARYNRAGAWLLVAAAVAVLPAGLLVDAHGPWTLLIPAALAVLGLGACIFGATITPLSNEGVRRAARLRGYRRHLTDVGRGKDSRIPDSISAALPFAVAFGLADAWSKVMKRHHHGVPPWFHALPTGDDRGAFNAFIVTGGAGAASRGGGTGVGGAGGAAGGGSSGAS